MRDTAMVKSEKNNVDVGDRDRDMLKLLLMPNFTLTRQLLNYYVKCC